MSRQKDKKTKDKKAKRQKKLNNKKDKETKGEFATVMSGQFRTLAMFILDLASQCD